MAHPRLRAFWALANMWLRLLFFNQTLQNGALGVPVPAHRQRGWALPGAARRDVHGTVSVKRMWAAVRQPLSRTGTPQVPGLESHQELNSSRARTT